MHVRAICDLCTYGRGRYRIIQPLSRGPWADKNSNQFFSIIPPVRQTVARADSMQGRHDGPRGHVRIQGSVLPRCGDKLLDRYL